MRQGEVHDALLDAARTGLILRQEKSYAFLHDRIHEAAYALIPESQRAGEHLRIGRALQADLTASGIAEHLFDVANQLNRGAALLIDRAEKVQVAAIDLRAGQKAKASAAFALAREYFSTGMTLLDESDWSSQYELTFSLWLEESCAPNRSWRNTRMVFIPRDSAQPSSRSMRLGSKVSACHISSWLIAVAGM